MRRRDEGLKYFRYIEATLVTIIGTMFIHRSQNRAPIAKQCAWRIDPILNTKQSTYEGMTYFFLYDLDKMESRIERRKQDIIVINYFCICQQWKDHPRAGERMWQIHFFLLDQTLATLSETSATRKASVLQTAQVVFVYLKDSVGMPLKGEPFSIEPQQINNHSRIR